jgi:hypothetical protein
MAAQTSYKQQCPSCEAMVLIKDPGLVGKKIECPKCKYKFVVEEPEGADDGPGTSRKGDSTATAKKPAKAGAGAKTGAGADRPRAKKKKGGKNMVVIGGILGVLAVVVLAGGAVMMFSGGGSNSTASNTKPSVPPGPVTPPNNAGPDATAAAPDATGAAPATPTGGAPTGAGNDAAATLGAAPASNVELTNLLPNDAETVLAMYVDRFRNSTLGTQTFESAAGFKPGTFAAKLGIDEGDMARFVRAENLQNRWAFNAIRTTQRVALDDWKDGSGTKHAGLKTALGLTKGPKSPIQGKEYWLLAPNDLLDGLGSILQSELESKEAKDKEKDKAKKYVAESGPLTLYLVDPTTVVIANLDPMEEFLKNGAKWDQRSRSAEPAGGNTPGGPTGTPSGTPSGSAVIVPHGFGAPAASDTAPFQGRGPRKGGGAGGGGDPANPDGSGPLYSASATYLTVDPALKAMLDRLEGAEPEVIAVMVQNLQADQHVVERVRDLTGLKGVEPNGLKTLGMALYALNAEKCKLAIGLECTQENIAREADKVFRKLIEDSVPVVSLFLGGLKIDFEGSTGAGSGGGGDDAGGGGLSGVGTPSGDSPPPRGGGPPPSGGNRGGPSGAPGDPNSEEPHSKLALTRRGRGLLFTADFNLTVRAYQRIFGVTESSVVRMKGLVDMANSQPHWFELAAAGVELRKSELGNFKAKDVIPPGTFRRNDGGATLTRTWAPNQRVSWMAGLLPYIGHQDYYDQLKRNKSWRDDENLKIGAILIPAFVDPTYPRASWRASVPSLGVRDLGATHFVGMAGVGIDAADYDPKDPSKLKKLGVFGYDRTTRVEDVKDGLANTIYVIQVPPTYPRPWIAGGGSTVQGVPETGSVKPFVRTHANGKRGTYALMADGSVRFISESISDDAFKALCTTQGGEEIDVNQVAPKVTPKGAELKTAGAAGPTGPTGGR